MQFTIYYFFAILHKLFSEKCMYESVEVFVHVFYVYLEKYARASYTKFHEDLNKVGLSYFLKIVNKSEKRER